MDETSLRRLAADRPQLTPELHLPNDFYGYGHLLKRWAGLRAWPPLPAVAEHGIPLQPDIWHVDLASVLPTLMAASPERARAYEAAAPGRVGEAIGAPIAYARARGEPVVPPRPADGPVLAFPAHSSHYAEARFDPEPFLDELERIRDRWGAVLICLYWRDVLNGAAAAYRARGFDCVTAGHIYDRRFLLRLRRLLTASRAVVTNDFGTHVIYAALLGRPTWIVEQDIDYHDSRAEPLTFVAPRAELARPLFAEERTDVSPEQAAFVAEVAGLGYERSPQQLAAMIASARERLHATTTRAQRLVAGTRARTHLIKEAARFSPALRGRASR